MRIPKTALNIGSAGGFEVLENRILGGGAEPDDGRELSAELRE